MNGCAFLLLTDFVADITVLVSRSKEAGRGQHLHSNHSTVGSPARYNRTGIDVGRCEQTINFLI